ncbi:MAG: peptidase [Proteobacteria bacterium]|nr:peptidase [Pseudomonadota bacterium]
MRKPLIFLCSVLAAFSFAAAPLAAAATAKHPATNAKQTSKPKVKSLAAAKKTVHKVHAKKNGKTVSSRAIANARRDVRVARASARPSTLEHPGVQSAGALVINQLTGEVIYEKNADSITPIASITKLMTAMVVLDAKLPLNELISISEEDVDKLKGTGSRLSPGLTLTRGEMLLLALMSSENRAASALSRHYPGGREAFVQAMNNKAASLGMHRSRFLDSSGLNPNNVSTARELALMVKAARDYPEIHQFSTSSEYSLTSSRNGRTLAFHNTNPLVKNDSWEIGLSKTGYINEAGHCIVMQAKINDTPVVMVLMDSTGKYTRIGDAQRVRRWLETSPVAKLRAG